MAVIRNNFYPEYMISKRLLFISIWNSGIVLRSAIIHTLYYNTQVMFEVDSN